jgi:hypothetical protein
MKYRIVTDSHSGYEVQYRYKWWPFWIQHGYTNTHSSIESALRYIEEAKMRQPKKQIVVWTEKSNKPTNEKP